MDASDVVDIEETVKRYKDEWLLFEVLETDDLDRPTKGRLLCHSKSRDEIHEVAMKERPKEAMTVFTGDPVPPGMIVSL